MDDTKPQSPVMRAKMQVNSVTPICDLHTGLQTSERLSFSPVSGQFGPNGESEDNTYARYSPSGVLRLEVNNPALWGKLKAGEKYYLDFTKAVS